MRTVQLRAPDGAVVQCESLQVTAPVAALGLRGSGMHSSQAQLVPSGPVVTALLVGRQIYTTVALCLMISTLAPARLLVPACGACAAPPCLPYPGTLPCACQPRPAGGEGGGARAGGAAGPMGGEAAPGDRAAAFTQAPTEVVCIATTLVVASCVQPELVEFSVAIP